VQFREIYLCWSGGVVGREETRVGRRVEEEQG
jgi:hypothetical protein